MQQVNKKSTTIITIIIIILFALSLTGLRIAWNSHFQYDKSQPLATAGNLDLREWDFSSKGIVTLSGEWTFYPDMLINNESAIPQNEKTQLIEVPGDWSNTLNEDKDNSYGYGTYHLRIKTNPKQNENYRIHVTGARSASTLYINGEQAGSSGQVGTSELESHARNVPFISETIKPSDTGEIDLFLQVSNFEDPRKSGLIRYVKFGYAKDLVRETNLSAVLQLTAAVIFLLHAIFALIVYFVGFRDRKLVCFSIMAILLAVTTLSISDEKILYQFIKMDYEFTLKGASLLGLSFILVFVLAMRKQLDNLKKYIWLILNVIYLILITILIVLPINYLDCFLTVIGIVILLTVGIIVSALIRAKMLLKNTFWITLAYIATISHFFWFFYLMFEGVKVVYYPFDLVIAMICIAIIWFKQYYEFHNESIELAEKLLVVDKTKDEFLANTSHELRNPLHSILNISQAVLQREHQSLHEESITDLETILSVSQRMSFMLNELLDIAAIEDGRPKLQLQSVSMEAIAAGVIDMVTYSAEGKSIKITNNISNDTPYVYGDEDRLIQIMFNLLHNAIKYTPEGEVEVNAESRNGYVHISVSDTGIGMDEKTLEEIFERYVQANNAGDITEGGFGIGLYICKQLIQLHGGEIVAKSTLGKGTTFTFSIPIATQQSSVKYDDYDLADIEVAASNAPVTLREQPSEMNNRLNDRPRIIVVDDEKVNLRVIETVLPAEQYEITSVLSAKKVLHLLDEREWDLIISDVMMPEMSGYELTRKVRERFNMSELPILLITARSNPEDIKVGFSSGANDYVTKPIDASELQSRVNALTSVRQSMRERLRLESAWLQAQIKPHFIFNTLNSIIALSQFDVDRMTKTLNAFSDMLRAKFNFENVNELVPIDQELNLIRSYVHIEHVRFGDRLQIELDIDENVNVMIPTLSIQPLVENAINHGVMRRDEGGKVLLKVKQSNHFVEVIVEDDGVGMERDVLQKITSGSFHEKLNVGLININLRLQRLFGEGLTISSKIDQGTTVSFRVPKGH